MAAIKQEIYIDLGDLLPEGLGEAFKRAQEGKDEKIKKKFSISTPMEWRLAFATYAVVITHFHPTQALPLLGYMAIILGLAQEVCGTA